MSLPKFDLLQPKTLQEACDVLKDNRNGSIRILAGGTDILVDIRRKIIPEHLPRCKGCEPGSLTAQTAPPPPKLLVALSRIPELKGIRIVDDEIRIGAMTVIAELCQSEIVKTHLTALYEGAVSLGSPLVRNRGAIGGNICNARPAADTLIPAVALNATLKLQSAQGARDIPVSEFVTGPGKTKIQSDEILTEIIFKIPNNRSASAFYKLANRKALEISIVNIAVILTLDNEGAVTEGRIAMGAVGPTPIIALEAMKSLIGKKPSDDLLSKAARIAASEAKPISDHRGAMIYRREMVEVLVHRMLNETVNRIDLIKGC